MIVLKDKDFYMDDDKLSVRHKAFKGKQGLIFFKTEWCGYCQRAKPEFEKASDILGTSFPIGTVDCDVNKLAPAIAGVQGYPTIKFCDKNGKLTEDYNSDRNLDTILHEICIKAKKCF